METKEIDFQPRLKIFYLNLIFNCNTDKKDGGNEVEKKIIINVNVSRVLENNVIKQVIETKFLGIIIFHGNHTLVFFQRIFRSQLESLPKLTFIFLLKFLLSSKEENLPIFILEASYIRFKSHQKKESKNLYQLLGVCSHYMQIFQLQL